MKSRAHNRRLLSYQLRWRLRTLFADYRSYLVNLDHIRELQPIFHGDYTVKLADCTELTLSRNYREKLLEPLDHLVNQSR